MGTKTTTNKTKQTVKNANNDLTDKQQQSETTSTTDEQIELHFDFDDNKNVDLAGKIKLAQDILVRIIDFNNSQLLRRNVEKVLVYENPAEYAADVVNELYERIKL